MKTVVITGASGFVGSSLARKLLNKGIEIIALDLKRAGEDRLPIDNNLHFYECDIFNQEQIKNICSPFHPDTFYHFAWVGVGSSPELRGNYDIQVKNALNTVELMKTAKEVGCERFIVAGTIMEHETIDAVVTQSTKPGEAYLYGSAKFLAHSITKIVSNKIGIKLIWTYITNTYGVGEQSDRLINSTIRKCIKKEELNFTTAKQRYDFIYIDDVAEAFYLLGEKGKENKAYTIGSGKPVELKQYLSTIINICDNTLKPNFGTIPFTGTDIPESYFATEEIEKDCNFKPLISFEEGIKRTFEWIKKVDNQ